MSINDPNPYGSQWLNPSDDRFAPDPNREPDPEPYLPGTGPDAIARAIARERAAGSTTSTPNRPASTPPLATEMRERLTSSVAAVAAGAAVGGLLWALGKLFSDDS